MDIETIKLAKWSEGGEGGCGQRREGASARSRMS